MRSAWRILFCFLFALLAASPLARAQDLDLEDDTAPKKNENKSGEEEGFGTYKPPIATIKPRTYTLAECLALADRNHPNLWAGRARLAFTHGQLDEARYTPYWGSWYASSNFGVLPGPITGTSVYNATPLSMRGLGAFDQPSAVFSFDMGGAVPLYTFGKITNSLRAAEANVRQSEWDMEKWRSLVRMDVRRAYFGLLAARDGKYLVDDILSKIDKGLSNVKKKLAKGDTSVEEADRLRLELIREEVLARAGEPTRGEAYAIAALRFMTGIQTAFDVPDEPLKPPTTPVAPVVRYLTAARLFRPEVPQSRAGIEARQAWVDFQRSNLFPNLGVGFNASYAVAPGVQTQNDASGFWANHFLVTAGIGMRWSLDFLPQSARIAQAESQLEETRALSRLALGGIAVEVENAYATVIEAKGREETWARHEHKSREWISTVTDAIDIGAKDERALIEPLRFYMNSRSSHLVAILDYNIALADLARVSGWDSAAPTGT
jgi:outer membrane protein TolC